MENADILNSLKVLLYVMKTVRKPRFLQTFSLTPQATLYSQEMQAVIILIPISVVSGSYVKSLTVQLSFMQVLPSKFRFRVNTRYTIFLCLVIGSSISGYRSKDDFSGSNTSKASRITFLWVSKFCSSSVSFKQRAS